MHVPRIDPAAFTVSTARLILRRPESHDAAALFAIHGDPRTHSYSAGPDADLEETRERLDAWRAHWNEHGFGYWVVLSKESGAVIGVSGVLLREIEGETVLNLYYRFAPECWGKGIATEAAWAALDLSGRLLPQLRVVAIINPLNAASVRVAERAGLRREKAIVYDGNQRDLYVSRARS